MSGIPDILSLIHSTDMLLYALAQARIRQIATDMLDLIPQEVWN